LAEELADRVVAMYIASSTSTPPAREKLDQAYRGASSLAPNHAQLPYAFSLALLQQHRWNEASQSLAQVVAAQPDDWRAWQAMLWVDLKRQSYAQSLVDLERFAATLPKTPNAETDEDAIVRRVEFLGHLVGYLKATQPKSLNGDDLLRARAEVLASLGEARSIAFLNAENEVETRYHLAMHDQRSLDAEAQAKAERLKQNAERNLDRQKSKLDVVEQHFGKNVANLDRAAVELAQVIAKLNDLYTQHAILDAQMSAIQAELNAVPYVVSLRRPAAYAIQNAEVVARVNLYQVLNQQIVPVRAEILKLEARRATLVTAGVLITAQANQEAIATEQAKDNLHADRKKLLRQTAHPVTAPKRMAEEARKLDSYEVFPLQAEQDRVLTLLRR
jgi:hypothetical protein